MPGNKYYFKRISQIGLAPGKAVFSISARCFHMILDDKLLNYSKRSDDWELVFHLVIECVHYTTYYDFSMRSNCFSILGHVIWILVIEISDLGTRVYKSGRFISTTSHYVCYDDLHSYMFRPIIGHFQGIKKFEYLVLWNLVVWW
jgi:hypothetical protein